MRPRVDVVIPTAGRASLQRLLEALEGYALGRVLVSEDRDRRGPAWARNAGWRSSRAEWIAFLDDDVVPEPGWAAALAADLAPLPADVGASQGRVHVPPPTGRRPTDWERDVAGLQDACWITADLAVRRAALQAIGGFDERFGRAYREDADLCLRLAGAGWRITAGQRRVTHPVGRADPGISVRRQAGNADDALMRRLHGRAWRRRARAGRGALPWHVATVTGAALALPRRTRALGAAAWLALTGRFAWRRIAPGPRTPREVATMVATSIAIPFAAVAHRLRGAWRARGQGPWRAVDAVLLDRDGTLVVDVPYNGDPRRVEAVAGAREALDRLRAAGVPLAVVSNQSGVARGLLADDDVAAVNHRVDELLGPIAAFLVCPHGPGDGCDCRKPRPGLLLAAARRLGVAAERCAMIGDIGADVNAARAAGVRAVLVPTAATRADEIAAAPEVAPDLPAAVDLLLGARA